jgi:hypothetical protein
MIYMRINQYVFKSKLYDRYTGIGGLTWFQLESDQSLVPLKTSSKSQIYEKKRDKLDSINLQIYKILCIIIALCYDQSLEA